MGVLSMQAKERVYEALKESCSDGKVTAAELAQKLNLNSGSVFRDLNSLYNARLLFMESSGGRNCYRTNLPVVRNMMERMLGYLQNQG